MKDLFGPVDPCWYGCSSRLCSAPLSAFPPSWILDAASSDWFMSVSIPLPYLAFVIVLKAYTAQVRRTPTVSMMATRPAHAQVPASHSLLLSELPPPSILKSYHPPYQLLPTQVWRCCQCKDGPKNPSTEVKCTTVKAGNTCGHVKCDNCTVEPG